MISFYPGPSRVYDQIPRYFSEAFESGVLGINHRSEAFAEICREAIILLKEKVAIPENYQVFFVSSATECWEIIAQSLVASKSLHIYNGAFGERWYYYTHQLKPESLGIKYSHEEQINIDWFPERYTAAELIAVTHNETSNGTSVESNILEALRDKFSEPLIAVDATSSMGGIDLDMSLADIWFASVQKCFGLPAGVGLIICSEKAIAKAHEVGECSHYNSLIRMEENLKKFQTTHTPNIINIYLLKRILQDIPDISENNQILLSRYKNWVSFIRSLNSIRLYIKNDSVRSRTVLVIEAEPKLVKELKDKASDAGFILGNGYGDLSDHTFRIANFPAIRNHEIAALQNFLKHHCQ